ncbi:hypothetical protein BGZ61DRAFT_534730 [Ilyonectria robusta]|uniref:uncharacterized protein n=1 Tax=Ilyonectria robusta TaxID=1079257 RepID=UPI001E8D831D|nr:uncharacterized protein BGZ61DRAFT_534730 [Ilyonectria robusta]KAH8684050.1 hypothetical protein BGZ61DRAFT_534730 [Ilyonectria robusta]
MPEIYASHPDYGFARDFKGYGEKGLEGLKWPNKAKIAIFPIYSFTPGGERSVLSGDGVAETNLPEHPEEGRQNERNYDAEAEYEYGLRIGFWRLFKAVEQQPEAVTRCVEEGHDIASHACRWVDHHDWSIEREKAYIRKGITSLKGLTGHAPRDWYYGRPSPHSRSLIPQVCQTGPQQVSNQLAVQHLTACGRRFIHLS